MWIIAFLPVGGLFIGLSYHLFGNSVVKGNNLLLEEFHSPKKIIPLRMAPLVLFGTIATHFLEVLQDVRELLCKLVVLLLTDLPKY